MLYLVSLLVCFPFAYKLLSTLVKKNCAIAAEKFPEILIAEEEEWEKCIQGSNGVVNLAGMPISTRWSSEVVYFKNLAFFCNSMFLTYLIFLKCSESVG